VNGKILKYIEDRVNFQEHEDEEGLSALEEESREQYVTIEDTVEAIDEITDMIMNAMESSQGLTEVRLRSIVSKLPEYTQIRIRNEFKEVDDDLFIDLPKEEEENDE